MFRHGAMFRLLKHGSRSRLPSAPRRLFAAMNSQSHPMMGENGLGIGIALGWVSVVVLSGAGYNWDDMLPSGVLEELKQHSPFTSLRPLRRIDEFYDVKSDEALGRGQFGTVSTAIDKATGEVVAVKCVPRSEASEAHFRTEADLHREVASHPNVVGLKGIYADEDCWYMVMELAKGGELFEWLTTDGLVLEGREIRSLLKGTAEAIAYLHDHSIVHADVKPENILLTAPTTAAAASKIIDESISRAVSKGTITERGQQVENRAGEAKARSEMARESPGTPGASVGKALLADFGSSFRMRGDGDGASSSGHKAVVKEYTVAYSAPEVVMNSPFVDHKADVWSLGVIAYVMMVGYNPFDATSKADDEKIAENILHLEPDLAGVEPEAARLIRRMLSKNPEDRPSAREVVQDSWLVDL